MNILNYVVSLLASKFVSCDSIEFSGQGTLLLCWKKKTVKCDLDALSSTIPVISPIHQLNKLTFFQNK